MAISAHPSSLVATGVAVLIAWRLYARIRRMVGRQQLKGARPWFTVCIFPVLWLLLLLSSWAHPLNALALVAGGVLGAALGEYGLRLTKFEQTPAGLFYTPNAHLGIALSVLLIARIGYRLAQVYFLAGQADPASMEFARSPLTLLIFGTLAGYYVRYAAGLLRWRSRVTTDGTGGTGGTAGGAESA